MTYLIPGMGKENALKYKHEHLRLMESIIKYCPTQLFIFVESESDASKPKIYVYYTKNKYPSLYKNKKEAETFVEECAQSKEIHKPAISDFKKYLSENINRIKERQVIKKGKEFYDDLIPNNIQTKLNEELQSDNAKKYSFSMGNVPINDDDTKLKQFLIDKCKIDWVKDAEIRKSKDGKIISAFKDEYSAEIMIDEGKEKVSIEPSKNNKILICCKDEDIDYVWEWIFWSDIPRFQMGKKGKSFFWGDRFHIGRIPKNYKFENSEFQINTFTFLLDGYCRAACQNCKKSKKSLKELLEDEDIANCNEIRFRTPENFGALKASDCIYVGACKETIKKNIVYETKFLEALKLKPKFLFLNMFTKDKESSSTHAPLSKAIKLVPPTTWIDNSLNECLNLPNDFALVFAEYFYEMLKESLKNNKEIQIVEIIAKTREKIEKLDSNAFWRLAYVVNGNPYTKFIRG
jgi:hypothetical protein